MAKRTTKVYETMFVVEGQGEFPLDMLRYDSAFPLTERDAHIAGDSHTERRRVALLSRRVNDNYPSEERWRSFCWVVVGVSTIGPKSRSAATDRRLQRGRLRSRTGKRVSTALLPRSVATSAAHDRRPALQSHRRDARADGTRVRGTVS